MTVIAARPETPPAPPGWHYAKPNCQGYLIPDDTAEVA
jgi:hypothetical protein